ncbi:integration host factor subunit alpha [Pseudahrensia aquimaris]|uniref:Integration host factor subunit alpha n=1 Tax=Pseudahrensia aquimaris TaxID=744461 RepID=A0ABW3FFP7_9HYPH
MAFLHSLSFASGIGHASRRVCREPKRFESSQDLRRARFNQMTKTLTRADLYEAVYRKVGLSRTESAQLVESVIEEICNAAVAGETIKLSSFGTFSIRSKNERVGRNPKTGQEVPITPRRVMVFRPSNILKEKVLEGNGGAKKKA